MSGSPLDIMVYAQHLSGVGHYVRTYEIARALAAAHRIHWVEGGRPVPHRPCPQLKIIALPRIRRAPGGHLQPLDDRADIQPLMAERARLLRAAVQRIRPEILVIEYFPFSKWELAHELLPVIESVRSRGGRVLCSVRDVVRKTRFEREPDAEYVGRVTAHLNEYFDALLVHADPNVLRLEESFEDAAKIQIPVHYTGIVSEPLLPDQRENTCIDRLTDGRPYVLASAGGGAGGRRLVSGLIEAWRDPSIADGRQLVICAGLDWPVQALQELARSSAEGRVLVQPFQAGFLDWLARADVSISQCGYNTAANLLQTKVPALVYPNTTMSDQVMRAQRLADLGLVQLLDQEIVPGSIFAAVDRALVRPTSRPEINLDGANLSRAFIEAL